MRTTWMALMPLLAMGALQAQPKKPVDATWSSLAAHEVPAWLEDAKFGIYAHWGVYSVPAFGTEWYGRRMYDPKDIFGTYQHHRKTYGTQDVFGYKDLVPLFKAEKFDPAEWAAIIQQSGARYAGTAVVHHDGFLLWRSKVSRWSSAEMGPKRDLYGELVKSLRAKGLKIVATEHHMRTFNWYLPSDRSFVDEQRKAKFDLYDPRYADLYWNEFTGKKSDFMEKWQAKLLELMDNYRPDVLWFDGGDFTSPGVETYVRNSLAHYFNAGASWPAQVEVLNKFGTIKEYNFPRRFGMLTFEAGRDRPAEVDRPWIDDLSIAKGTWSYVDGMKLLTTQEVLHGLIDRVSRGGGLLLSLAPKASGEIPEDQKTILREMGEWLKVNGEAIYGTRTWKVHTEGSTEKLITNNGQHTGWRFDNCGAEDIRFTRKGDSLYAIALGWPQTGHWLVKSLAGTKIKSVSMLGGTTLKWSQGADGLRIEAPATQPGKYAYTFKITL